MSIVLFIYIHSKARNTCDDIPLLTPLGDRVNNKHILTRHKRDETEPISLTWSNNLSYSSAHPLTHKQVVVVMMINNTALLQFLSGTFVANTYTWTVDPTKTATTHSNTQRNLSEIMKHTETESRQKKLVWTNMNKELQSKHCEDSIFDILSTFHYLPAIHNTTSQLWFLSALRCTC